MSRDALSLEDGLERGEQVNSIGNAIGGEISSRGQAIYRGKAEARDKSLDYGRRD
jgi:hypothetical protein